MEHCIFCHQIKKEQILYQTKYFKIVLDIAPIQTGHLLIISKDHYDSITQLPTPALHDLIETQATLTAILEEIFPIAGVTSACNDRDLKEEGTHFHLHLIPRVKNDGFWNLLNIKTEDFPLDHLITKLKKGDE